MRLAIILLAMSCILNAIQGYIHSKNIKSIKQQETLIEQLLQQILQIYTTESEQSSTHGHDMPLQGQQQPHIQRMLQ